MTANFRLHSSLLIVALAHLAVLGAIIGAPALPPGILVEPPTIQGALVSITPSEQKPEPITQNPLPKTKKTSAKAPASKRAISEQTQPEQSVQPEPGEKTTEDPVEPAPVEPPRADASHLNNPAPAYPTQSRRMSEEGTVLLEVLVKADGSLGEVKLKQSSGFNRLDEAALRAVKNWHFVPAKQAGEAIDFWYQLPIEFSLNH